MEEERGMGISRTKQKLNHALVLFGMMKNPFPVDEQDLYGELWYGWVSRILDGQKKEQKLINDKIAGLNSDEIELYADDYFR